MNISIEILKNKWRIKIFKFLVLQFISKNDCFNILHKWHFLKKWIGCNIVSITWTPVIKFSVVSLNKIWRLSKHGEYNKFPCPFDQRLNLNDIWMIFEFAKKINGITNWSELTSRLLYLPLEVALPLNQAFLPLLW